MKDRKGLDQSMFNDNIRKGSKIMFIGKFYPEGVQIFEKFMPCKSQWTKSNDKTCSNCKGKLKIVGRDLLICGRSSHKPNTMNLTLDYSPILEDDLFDI